MKVEDLFYKKPFERRLSDQSHTLRSSFATTIPSFDNGKKINVTQTQFLNELNPESHIVHNVNYRSNRPKYKWDEVTKKNIQIGWEDVSRVAVAIQQSLRLKKAVCTYGNEIWIGNEDSEDKTDEIAKIKSHWATSSMQSAMLKCGMSFFGTGDGAVYLYKEGNEIKYRTFSFEDGDVLCLAREKDTGKDIGIRLFKYRDLQAVEIYGTEMVELWVKEENNATLKKWWDKINGKRSDDGYTLISSIPHNLSQSPFCYHREDDVCWAAAQSTIEHVEKTMSDLSENNKYYAFQILFLKGGAIELPSVDYQGKALGGKSDTSDAKILEPANCSDSFTLDLNKNIEFIYETTSTTEVKPSELKGGDYSGAYLRNLYFRDVQWSTVAYARLDPFMKKVLSVFKELVGQIERDTITYNNLRLSYRLIPFLPQNEMEEITIINQCVNSGTMSIQSATEELPRSNPREYDRIKKEALELAETKAKSAELVVDNTTNEAKSKREE